jgi:hypothetical protein
MQILEDAGMQPQAGIASSQRLLTAVMQMPPHGRSSRIPEINQRDIAG